MKVTYIRINEDLVLRGILALDKTRIANDRTFLSFQTVINKATKIMTRFVALF